MQYRFLGRTGLRVSELCFGCMTFGRGFYGIGEVAGQRGATALVERALAGGINIFDSADVYSFGQSEMLLGRAIKELGVDRDSLITATKVRGPMSEAASEGSGDPNNVGLSRKHIIVVEKLDALQGQGLDHPPPRALLGAPPRRDRHDPHRRQAT